MALTASADTSLDQDVAALGAVRLGAPWSRLGPLIAPKQSHVQAHANDGGQPAVRFPFQDVPRLNVRGHDCEEA